MRYKTRDLLNSAYVYNMGMADYDGSSITDVEHLVMYAKDSLDDLDGVDGRAMHHWYDYMINKGIPVYWEDFIWPLMNIAEFMLRSWSTK